MAGAAMLMLAAASGAHANSERVLFNFFGTPFGDSTTGNTPVAGLIRDASGNLYGTTALGGDFNGIQEGGVVFKVSPRGKETVLHTFTGNDGQGPAAGLLMDANGNLYGTTAGGGAANDGVVFRVTPHGRETVLHSFAGGDGATPMAGVIVDAGGNLYGTTRFGGAGNEGVVFKLSPSGKETVLYSFTGGDDGSEPLAGLVRDGNGNFYGTTSEGGANNAGVVFKLTPRGRETVLYSFTGGDDGGLPRAGLILDADGNLYGTTSEGGPANDGVVFKLSPGGRETVLYSFTGGNDGAFPFGGVIRDTNGNLYGTANSGGVAKNGVVFRVTPRGRETVLYSFTDPGGANPAAGLIMDENGNLYGTASVGGTGSGGFVFEVKNRAAGESMTSIAA
jgi:uncharacterized repeat protein (TIGR03803 family)